MKIGFLGAGKMGLALAQGIIQTEADFSTLISDPDAGARERFLQQIPQAVVLEENQAVCREADVVFVACKPQQLAAATESLSCEPSKALYISILAGVTTQRLVTALGSKRVVRAMPNTPCLIGQGVLGLAVNPALDANDQDLAERLLANVGTVVRVPEAWMDAVTGISGSGPAYVFKFIEAMIQSGLKAGLEPSIARLLVIETFRGAAELLRATGAEPDELRQQVSSPGGTTMAGLAVLDQRGLDQIIQSAVGAAIERSRELAGSS
ncbi:MAG: pyrroline-5-carboxylate reductase [Mariniblastus sp.]|nr:pyrroline-5-carboxylate reductase [Mariniblastus sp.]